MSFGVTSTNLVVCSNGFSASLDAEGRWVAYQTRPAEGRPSQVYLHDVETGQAQLLSVKGGQEGGNGNSCQPLLSHDGRFVVFVSEASDLTEQDQNHASDIFVRDVVLRTTMLASGNSRGTGSGNGKSFRPVLSRNGRTVLFASLASDLVTGDYNDTVDLFILQLGAGDSDADGLDDDWEVAFFGNLTRDGTEDLDGDGHSDEQEFRAGTDPTDSGSIFRVITLTGAGQGPVTILWSAVPGKAYRAQFKASVTDRDWTNVAGDVVAQGSTGTAVDTTGGGAGHRFYRVVLLP